MHACGCKNRINVCYSCYSSFFDNGHQCYYTLLFNYYYHKQKQINISPLPPHTLSHLLYKYEWNNTAILLACPIEIVMLYFCTFFLCFVRIVWMYMCAYPFGVHARTDKRTWYMCTPQTEKNCIVILLHFFSPNMTYHLNSGKLSEKKT